MKTLTFFKSPLFSISMALLLIFSITSCSTTMPFIDSAIVPAAKGSAKVSKDDNNNYKIEVTVTNLADPSKLNPPKKMYIVWVQTEEYGNQNIGQMVSSSGLFSSTLKGSLTTVSSYKPKKVFITAENDANIQYPGPRTVLYTRNY